MKVLNKLCFLLILLTLISCKKEIRNTDEIEERYFNLEKIGWKSRVHNQLVDDINFTATEVPIQYYLLKSEGKNDLIKIDSIYEANKTERIIEFTFHQDEEKDLLEKSYTGMDYEQGIKYLSFAIDKDFYVVTSKNDTIRCSGVNFERNYKVAPYQKILLFFSGISHDEKIQLVYQDYLFQKGTIKFKFKDPYTKIKL